MNEQWRDKLLTLRAELESQAESGQGAAAVVELDQAKVGRLSRMDAMQAQAMAQASSNRRQTMLVKVTAALKTYAKMVTSADKGAVRDLSLLD